MAGDMSESVNFIVYCGHGNVRSNEMGVDLSDFDRGQLQLPNLEKVNISLRKSEH